MHFHAFGDVAARRTRMGDCCCNAAQQASRIVSRSDRRDSQTVVVIERNMSVSITF